MFDYDIESANSCLHHNFQPHLSPSLSFLPSNPCSFPHPHPPSTSPLPYYHHHPYPCPHKPSPSLPLSLHLNSYVTNYEEREEAGTPNILGDIRLGLAFLVKESFCKFKCAVCLPDCVRVCLPASPFTCPSGWLVCYLPSSYVLIRHHSHLPSHPTLFFPTLFFLIPSPPPHTHTHTHSV